MCLFCCVIVGQKMFWPFEPWNSVYIEFYLAEPQVNILHQCACALDWVTIIAAIIVSQFTLVIVEQIYLTSSKIIRANNIGPKKYGKLPSSLTWIFCKPSLRCHVCLYRLPWSLHIPRLYVTSPPLPIPCLPLLEAIMRSVQSAPCCTLGNLSSFKSC